MNVDRARTLIESFSGKRVLVVGDVMLDEFVRGDVSRISPEAPVPVVELRHRDTTPGGAGNAAANVVSLGGAATLVALVGTDSAAPVLCGELERLGIETRALVATAERSTTHKLRVIAHTQQIVRVDVETRAAPSASVEQMLLDSITSLLDHVSAVLVSDYAKGVVTPRVARETIAAARARGLPVVVDPKGRDYSHYRGATVITPNVLELDTVANTSTHNEDAAIVEAGTTVLDLLGGAQLLVTRGPRGMTLLGPERSPLHLPTLARSVFDGTGAGDTVVGALTLALASGVAIEEALVLASQAARIAVSRVGTVAVSRDELLASMSTSD
jgi:rfaE bifunctional protein kinase chain/domain